MPRPEGNDLCELFGYAPDDKSDKARLQWKSQQCPFVGNICIKHTHPLKGEPPAVYGSCSVVNKRRNQGGEEEEVIICPQRLYANKYEALKLCFEDAIEQPSIPLYMAPEYSEKKKSETLPSEYGVLLGQNSSGEIILANRSSEGKDELRVSLDWVAAHFKSNDLVRLVPCEVQSIDTTGNYFACWRAYANEMEEIPNSNHGMNWANVWKRLIPQLIFKGEIAYASRFCDKGIYFVLPHRVFREFQKWVGCVPEALKPNRGVLTVHTYTLGPKTNPGEIRGLVRNETTRMLVTDFAKAFGSGQAVRSLGTILDDKVKHVLEHL